METHPSPSLIVSPLALAGATRRPRAAEPAERELLAKICGNTVMSEMLVVLRA